MVNFPYNYYIFITSFSNICHVTPYLLQCLQELLCKMIVSMIVSNINHFYVITCWILDKKHLLFQAVTGSRWTNSIQNRWENTDIYSFPHEVMKQSETEIIFQIYMTSHFTNLKANMLTFDKLTHANKHILGLQFTLFISGILWTITC